MIVGDKIILEAIDPENKDQLRIWRNDPEMRKYFREWKDISKDMQEKWYLSKGNNSDPNHVYFQIMTKQDQDLIGCCGLHYVDWRLRSAEFGVFLCNEARGTGCGFDSLKTLFDYGFREMNLHKIWCEVYDNNVSVKLYRKLGFKDDGIMRDNYFCDGKYGNSIVMSVLEDEWHELQKKEQ